MKNILIFILFVIFVKTKAQFNFIDNPGFETRSASASCTICPSNYAPVTQEFNYWASTPPWEIPQATTICNGNIVYGFEAYVGSPDTHCGATDAHSGSICAFTIDGEYIQQQMPTPLKSKHLYYIEYWAKPTTVSNPSSNDGIKFYMKRPKQCHFGPLKKKPGQPDIAVSKSLFDGNWHKVAGYYQATDNFNYFVIGMLDNNGATKTSHAGCYWDDFKVIEIGDDICPNINYIQNIIFQNTGGFVYESSTLTTAGNNVDPSQTAGDVTVTNTSAINFQSETQVALKPGFSVQPGANFHAYIAPCNSNCASIIAYVGGEDSYCSMPGQQVQLGGAGASIATYNWTATFADGTPCNCLSNTSISNPILTIPSGAGVIDVSVTAYNTCNNTSTTDEQAIYYDDNPQSNPVINVSTTNIVINANSPNPAFTITGDSHTQDVEVQLYDQNNNILNDVLLEDFQLTTNGTNSFYYNQYDIAFDILNPCNTYYYLVTSSDICNTSQTSSVRIDVVPQSNITVPSPPPNVFTPNGDGINDIYCWPGVVGATSYAIYVYSDDDGGLVYNGTGSITSNTPCFWAGQCNSGCGYEHQNGIVCNGVYSYIVYLYNCQGQLYNNNGIDGFVELYSYCARLKSPGDTINLSSPKIGPKIIPVDSTVNDSSIPKGTALSNITNSQLGAYTNANLYPNPTTGVTTLTINAQNTGKLKVKVASANGTQLKENAYDVNAGLNNFKLDLSDLSQGVYFVAITDINGVVIKNCKLVLLGQ